MSDDLKVIDSFFKAIYVTIDRFSKQMEKEKINEEEMENISKMTLRIFFYNDVINVFNLLYSITARLDNPEICKDFSKIMTAEVYIIARSFKNRYFDGNFFKKEPREAEFDAKKDRINALVSIFEHFSKENINLNLNADTLEKDYPTCSKSLFSIINNFE